MWSSVEGTLTDKSDINETLLGIVRQAIAEKNRKKWKSCFFAPIQQLTADGKGTVGERFVAEMLRKLGHDVEHNQSTDRTKKGYDIMVDGKIKLEVKLATLGNHSNTFQHESIERNRDYDAIVFIDVGPDDVYITCAKKEDLPFSSKSCKFTVKPKMMHKRDTGSLYKWDFSLKDVENRRVRTLNDFSKIFAGILG